MKARNVSKLIKSDCDFVKRVIIFSICILISGCSTTVYKNEIIEFRKATEGAETVFNNLVKKQRGAGEKIALINAVEQSKYIILRGLYTKITTGVSV